MPFISNSKSLFSRLEDDHHRQRLTLLERAPLSTLATAGVEVRRDSVLNEARRATVSNHLRDQREVFGSTPPNNHRRLGDDLERVQVQQAIIVTTPPNGTATTTAVTASAPETRKRRAEAPVIGTLHANVERYRTPSPQRRRVDSPVDLTQSLTQGGTQGSMGSTQGGTPGSMGSHGTMDTNDVSLAERSPEVGRSTSNFPYGSPCQGCKLPFCRNMRALYTIKNKAMKKFSPHIHNHPLLIGKNGLRRHALYKYWQKHTGGKSIKSTPYCVVMLARGWFPELGQTYARDLPPKPSWLEYSHPGGRPVAAESPAAAQSPPPAARSAPESPPWVLEPRNAAQAATLEGMNMQDL